MKNTFKHQYREAKNGHDTSADVLAKKKKGNSDEPVKKARGADPKKREEG